MLRKEQSFKLAFIRWTGTLFVLLVFGIPILLSHTCGGRQP